MTDTPKPVQALIAQGWDPAHYSIGYDPSTGTVLHSFFMRRQGASKILTVRKKMIGQGVVIEEMEV